MAVTNAVLAEKIDTVHVKIKNVHTILEELKPEIKKNSTHRIQTAERNNILKFIIGTGSGITILGFVIRTWII